jgi:hypothetical protein
MRSLRSLVALAYLSILYGGCTTLLTDAGLSVLFSDSVLDSKEPLYDNRRFYMLTFYTGIAFGLQYNSFLHMFAWDAFRNPWLAWKMSFQTYFFLCYILQWFIILASDGFFFNASPLLPFRLAFNPLSATIITLCLECLGPYQIIRYMIIDEFANQI